MGEDRLARAKALLQRLIAFESVSNRSNLPLIAFVEDYLASFGVASRRAPNGSKDKTALFATVGPRIDGGVVLSGHTDVVPVDGQAWTSPPFVMREADGRLYGRGACDMKGFIACVLAFVPDFQAALLKRPVHILLSYDEETTCLGSTDVIAWFGKDEPRPAAAVVGEPTMMEVADAHKSVATIRTVVRGHEAHSALPALGANAVAAAADVVSEIGRLARPVREGTARPALRSALFDAACRDDPRRDGAQHPGARMRFRLGVPRLARRPNGCGGRSGAGLYRHGGAAAPDPLRQRALHHHRDRGRRAAARGRAGIGSPDARAAADPVQPDDRSVLRHPIGAFPGGGPCPPWSAGRGRSIRRTSPTNMSRSRSLRRASPFSAISPANCRARARSIFGRIAGALSSDRPRWLLSTHVGW